MEMGATRVPLSASAGQDLVGADRRIGRGDLLVDHLPELGEADIPGGKGFTRPFDCLARLRPLAAQAPERGSAVRASNINACRFAHLGGRTISRPLSAPRKIGLAA